MASFVETRGHAGDEGDFEALYETYKSDVQRLASYLLKNASDAEDAAQTVFLNVLRALRQGVTPSDPRAWLLAITRNVCFSRHRAAAARPNFVELDFEASEEPSGEETPSADEIVGALTRMLPNQRTALILRDFRGVSRSEIGRLMALSPAAVEALLTRARAVFREELEAGEQPFVCAETRAFVEKQLDGEITVADRHSLRSHLRHCGPCATLARAVRSSRGKLAGLIFWPFDLISRLAGAFSQASSVTHVAATIGATAAVATVAIPVAVSTSPGSTLVPWPTETSGAAAASAPASAPAAQVSWPAAVVVMHAAASKPAKHAGLQRRAPHKGKSASKHAAHAKPTAGTSAVAAPTRSGTPSTGTTTAPLRPTQSTAPSTSRPTTSAPTQSPSGITTPSSASPRSSSPISRPPTKSKPAAKPKTKPKSVRKPGKRGRHSPAPPDVMPSSTPPAADIPSGGDGAAATSGPGVTVNTDRSPAKSQSSSQGSSQSESSDAASSSNDSVDNGSNPNDKDKKDKDKDKDKNKDKDKKKH